MEHAEQVAQIKLLHRQLDTDTSVDAGGFFPNPTSVYVDADLARHERQVLFRDHPQLIGLSGDLPGPGSFLTIDDLDTPILATRDDSGRFRAYINVCRHRGAILERSKRGQHRRFTCEFHNWSYGTDGTLVNIPSKTQFGDLDQNCRNLIALPAEERHGLLWVHPDPEGTIDLDELIGAELGADLESWNLSDLDHLGDDSYEVDCNWKLAMDTFGETYHFPILHRRTLAKAFHGNVQTHDVFGNNSRILIARHEIDDMREQPEDEWTIGAATLAIHWMFPNVQLLPFPEGCYLVRVYPDPQTPGAHVSRITFYIRPGVESTADEIRANRRREAERLARAGGSGGQVEAPPGDNAGTSVATLTDVDLTAPATAELTADEAAAESRAAAQAHSDEQLTVAKMFAQFIRDEDYVLAASQQSGAESGAQSHVIFGRNELGLHHFHSTFRRVLDLEPIELVDQL